MRHIVLRAALACAAWWGLAGCGRTVPADGELAVIPQPASVGLAEGSFLLSARSPIVVGMEGAEPVARALDEVGEALFGRPLRRADSPAAGAVVLRRDTALAGEAYALTVSPEGIDIAAGSPAGAFYAVQTLRQLLPPEAFGAGDVRRAEIPCLTIVDEPCMRYRGVMLDAARHFFTVDEVKRLLDILALHKINTFHWHLTDRSEERRVGKEC